MSLQKPWSPSHSSAPPTCGALASPNWRPPTRLGRGEYESPASANLQFFLHPCSLRAGMGCFLFVFFVSQKNLLDWGRLLLLLLKLVYPMRMWFSARTKMLFQDPKMVTKNCQVGSGFKHVLFPPLSGEIFSCGLMFFKWVGSTTN